MAAPISTFLKKNNWNPWLSKELNNCKKIFAEFHDSCQYISVFLWINSVGSSMVEHSLPSKINLNADFVYQIEFMHKAMCTYIFWHFIYFFLLSGLSSHHSIFITTVVPYISQNIGICVLRRKHTWIFCVQYWHYSRYQMILRFFFISLFALRCRPCFWYGGYSRSHNLSGVFNEILLDLQTRLRTLNVELFCCYRAQ